MNDCNLSEHATVRDIYSRINVVLAINCSATTLAVIQKIGNCIITIYLSFCI